MPAVKAEERQKLSIEGLNKAYDLEDRHLDVLEDFSLAVEPGEFVSIIGTSGCGKSTLLRLIVGLESNYRGRILLGDELVTGPSIKRGMVFQQPRLFPWFTVEENVAFGLRQRCPPGEVKRLVEEHIALVGLQGFEKAYPGQLSGGMAQRVSIARALVNRPQLLLLDEPFGALDALTRIQMQQEILRIWSAEQTTMIMVTHDIDEAIYLGGRVVVMSSRPGTVKKMVRVELPRPRDRSSFDFIKVRRAIYREFFSEVENPADYII